MKYRIFLLPILCAALSIPSLSQQTNASAGQTPSQNVDTGKKSSSTSNDFWDGDEPNLVNLVTHPFASKKYVQRMVRPIRDRVNELEEINNTNHNAIRDIDARSQQGLQLASEKELLADQHASDAFTKAQSAQGAANDASTRVANVEHTVGSLDQYKDTSQTEIRFRPGQTVLSKQAKDALDDMAGPLKNQRSYIIEVRGYASGAGQRAITNSQKMADSVVRYLVLSQNIPVYRIYVLSMGNATDAEGSAKHISGGRVEVSLLKNDLQASAKR